MTQLFGVVVFLNCCQNDNEDKIFDFCSLYNCMQPMAMLQGSLQQFGIAKIFNKVNERKPSLR